jgi:hypothetical protein
MERDINAHYANNININGRNDNEVEANTTDTDNSNLGTEIINPIINESNINNTTNTEPDHVIRTDVASISIPDNIKQAELHLKEGEITKKEAQIKLTQHETLFCISVDGSEHSEHAFNLVTKEFLPNICHSKVLIMHVYNSQLDNNYNFRNQRDTIIEKYSTAALKLGKDCHYSWEDRAKNVHALDQVNRTAHNYKADYLVCGYFGIKGPKSDNKELTKGIDYLLSYSKVPTILVKEATIRDIKKQKGYNWLFVFDRAYVDCFNILKFFIKLVDKKLDKISALTLLPPYINYDDIKNKFFAVMEEEKITNYDYSLEEYKKVASAVVNEKINFGEDLFNFLVIYNKPERHKVEGEKSDIVTIVTKAKCNICFINSS